MDFSKEQKFASICRTCLNENGEMKNIFHLSENNLHYCKMISSCTQLAIFENDGLPVHICNSCALKLTKMYSFKSQCENADFQLRKYITNPFMELNPELVIDNFNKELFNEYSFDSEINVNINDKNIEKIKKKKINERAITLTRNNIKYKNKNITLRNKNKTTINIFGCRKCELHFLTWVELHKHNLQHKNEKNSLSCRYCGKKFIHHRHVIPHIKLMHKTIEKYQCGYCDKRFCNIQILKIHMKRHSKDILLSKDVNVNDNPFGEDVYINDKIEDIGIQDNSLENLSTSINFYLQDSFNNKISTNVTDDKSTISSNLMCFVCRELYTDVESLTSHMINEHGCMTEISDTTKNINLINVNESNKSKDIILNTDVRKDLNEYTDLLDNEYNESSFNNALNDEKIKSQSNNITITSDNICSICNKKFKTTKDLKRHQTTHDPDKPFHCQFGRCRWSFETEHALSIHINVNHSNGIHECRFCHKIFKHSRNLRQHMLQHQLTKRFKCKYCNKEFNHLHHLHNHERIHTGDLPFLCQQCGRAFATKDRLVFHIRRHSDIRPFGCEKCKKKFISSTDLKVHLKTHSGDRPFMCSVCGKTFTARYNLNKHIKSQHSEIISANDKIESTGDIEKMAYFKCDICGFFSETLQQLDQHMKNHTCQYFCPICQKSFALTSALDAHIKTHSTGNRSHVCNICGWAFNRAEHLRTHIARRHSMEEKPHSCPHCLRTFTRSTDLTTHLRTHSHQRPYICSECGRSFTQSGALRIHSRIHNDERPYICGVCHKAHRSAGSLTTHMRTHTSNTLANNITINQQDIRNKIDEEDCTYKSFEINQEPNSCQNVENINYDMVKYIDYANETTEKKSDAESHINKNFTLLLSDTVVKLYDKNLDCQEENENNV